MPLETATYIDGLESSNPASTDQLSQADDHIRLIKAVLLATFPNLTGPMTRTEDELNADGFSMPIGSIIAWYGSSASVPAGWAICQGQTVERSDDGEDITLPDLRGKIILGVSGSYVQGTSYGALTSSATTSETGHTHDVTGGDHAHDFDVSGTTSNAGVTLTPGYDGETWDRSGGAGKPITTVSASSHSHTIAVSGSTEEGSHTHTVEGGEHDHDVTVSTLQPSLALHYIMKV